MRKGHGGLGLLFIILGVLIILALILPSQFWWFMLAAGLIYGGICCYRCR